MATVLDVFGFAVTKDPRPFESFSPALRRVNASRTGRKFVLVKGDVLEFKGSVTVAIPQPADSGLDLSDLIAFADGHKAMAFLYMPYTGPSLRREALTDSTDGLQQDWALNHRYIDASSVEVYLDGVLQSSGWSLTGNNTAPTISFTAPPAGGKTLLVYANFYIPCVFSKSPLGEGAGITDNKNADADSPQSFAFEVVEIEPGARFVSATGMTGA